jgi:hypothetical protein
MVVELVHLALMMVEGAPIRSLAWTALHTRGRSDARILAHAQRKWAHSDLPLRTVIGGIAVYGWRFSTPFQRSRQEPNAASQVAISDAVDDGVLDYSGIRQSREHETQTARRAPLFVRFRLLLNLKVPSGDLSSSPLARTLFPDAE